MGAMRTLFDTPTYNFPDAADQAAPVPPIEAVLFDFANTIFHIIEMPDWLHRIAADVGRKDEFDDPDAVGKVCAELAEAYKKPEVQAAQVGRDTDAPAHRRGMYAWFREVEFLRGAEEAAYARMIADDSWVPYPDTGPLLRKLRELGIPVGVVSDIAWDIRAHVAHAGLEDLIGTYALSFEVGREKPDPQLFLKACADLGCDPRRTLMVGDNPARDGGATAVGMRAFILAGEHRTGERGLHQILPLLG
jgi:HAD superfamily hydrolase (TIGR01509 family)